MPQDEIKVPDALPDEDVAEIEHLVLVRIMRLNAVVNGIVLGLFFGVGLFMATLILVLKSGDVVGPHLSLLGQYLPGYSVTWGGSFIGLVYGLVLGFVGGAFGALVYNGIASHREHRANGAARRTSSTREGQG